MFDPPHSFAGDDEHLLVGLATQAESA